MRDRGARSKRDAWLNHLAERAARRTSAASRGELSLLAGAGVALWAILTVGLLVSAPQALPLAARNAPISIGVSRAKSLGVNCSSPAQRSIGAGAGVSS